LFRGGYAALKGRSSTVGAADGDWRRTDDEDLTRAVYGWRSPGRSGIEGWARILRGGWRRSFRGSVLGGDDSAGQGAKAPFLFWGGYAALKGRSSTVGATDGDWRRTDGRRSYAGGLWMEISGDVRGWKGGRGYYGAVGGAPFGGAFRRR